MNPLRRAIETVFHVQYKQLTGTQETGEACIHCGTDLPDPQRRTPWSCLGLPGRHRHSACPHACTVVTVDGTEDLFRAAIPTRQHIRLHHLGVDDTPDMDEQQIADLAAQPWLTVVIEHRRGTLTTAPLPVTYAEQIAQQAQDLGYTATTRQPDDAGSRS